VELVEELEWRGILVCRVSAEEGERSQRQRAVLGPTPSYQEGVVLAMRERSHAYRIDAETIAMKGTNTYDHAQNVAELLAGIEPQVVLSLSQAQEVVTQKANERGSSPIDPFEQLPSAWEIGRGSEAAVDAAEGVAAKGAEVVIALGEVLANALEGSLFGGDSRNAPGGAKYVRPAAAGLPPPLAVTKPPWLEKPQRLRTTSAAIRRKTRLRKRRWRKSRGRASTSSSRNSAAATRWPRGSGRSPIGSGTKTGIATEFGDGGLSVGTGLPTRGRSARAWWRVAAELASVRWLLRVERYRRAAEWVGMRMPGAVLSQEKAREREAGAATAGEAKDAK
jgi:hypothetical protein